MLDTYPVGKVSEYPIVAMAAFPDGRLLVADANSTIHVLPEGEEITLFRLTEDGLINRIKELAVLSDHQFVVWYADDYSEESFVELYDLREKFNVLMDRGRHLTSFAVLSGATAHDSKIATGITTPTGNLIRLWLVPKDSHHAPKVFASISPDYRFEKILDLDIGVVGYLSTKRGELGIANVRTKEHYREYLFIPNLVDLIFLPKTGNYMFVDGAGNVGIMAEGKMLNSTPIGLSPGGTQLTLIDPDAEEVACLSPARQVTIYRAGHYIQTLDAAQLGSPPRSICSSNGALVIGCEDGALHASSQEWSPDFEVHAAFPPAFRAIVCTVLALSARDPQQPRYAQSLLWVLPPELHSEVFKLASRGFFAQKPAAPQALPPAEDKSPKPK